MFPCRPLDGDRRRKPVSTLDKLRPELFLPPFPTTEKLLTPPQLLKTTLPLPLSTPFEALALVGPTDFEEISSNFDNLTSLSPSERGDPSTQNRGLSLLF